MGVKIEYSVAPSKAGDCPLPGFAVLPRTGEDPPLSSPRVRKSGSKGRDGCYFAAYAQNPLYSFHKEGQKVEAERTPLVLAAPNPHPIPAGPDGLSLLRKARVNANRGNKDPVTQSRTCTIEKK